MTLCLGESSGDRTACLLILEVILAVALGSEMLVSKQKDEMLSQSLEIDQ